MPTQAERNRQKREKARLAKKTHEPDASVASHLGAIKNLIPDADVVPGDRKKEKYFAYLPIPDGLIACKEVLYFETSELDLCTDGNTDSWGGVLPELGEGNHAGHTALDVHANDGKTTDANVLPYFVLPLTTADPNDPNWAGKDRGIRMGDVGAILGRNKVVYAQFAECGVCYKLGEASIKVLREFGEDRLLDHGKKAKRVQNSGITDAFATIVFPGTAPPRFRLSPDEITTQARTLFTKLGGLP